MEAIEHPPIFRLPGVPDHVTYTWIVMLILIGLAWFATRRASLTTPERKTPHGKIR